MSWFRQVGGSLSSMTGQLSSLTKDILAEGTEESEDHETELKLAKIRIRELEAAMNNHRSEIDRLQSQNSDLEMKSKTAEFQVQSLNDQYKETIAEKEREIALLRERGEPEGGPSVNHSGYGHQNRQRMTSIGLDHDETFASEEDAFASGGCVTSPGGFHSAIGTEQQLVDKAFNNSSALDAHRFEDVGALKEEIEELRDQLIREEESRRQELAALQDAHTHQISTLKRQQRDAVALERDRQRKEDGALEQELESTRRLVEESRVWKKEMEERLGLLSQHGHLIDALRSALTCCSPENLESLLGDAVSYLETKQQLKGCQQTIRELEEERDSLRHQCQQQQQQQSLGLQSSTSNSLLDVGEALSQLSDLSNISVRSRQLEEHMRHLTGQIEAYEAQIETSGMIEEESKAPNGTEETDEMKNLRAKLNAKQEAMRLLRAKKSQLRRGDRRHGRRNGSRGGNDVDDSANLDQISSSHLEAVEEIENRSTDHDDFAKGMPEASLRDSTTSPLVVDDLALQEATARVASLESCLADKDRLLLNLQSSLRAKDERLAEFDSQMSALHRLLPSSSPSELEPPGVVRQVHCILQAHNQAQNERSKLSQRLSSVMAERDAYSRDLLGEIDILKSENDRLIGEQMRTADEAKIKLTEEREKREMLELALEDLQKQLADNSDSEQLVGGLKEVVTALQADKEGLESQVEALREELEASGSVSSNGEDVEKLMEEKESVRMERDELKARVYALQVDRQDLELQLRSLRDESEPSMSDEGHKYLQEREDLKSKLHVLQGEKAGLETQLDSMRGEIESSRRNMMAEEESSKRIQSLQVDNENLRAQVEALSEEAEASQTALLRRQDEETQLRADKKQLESQIETLMAEVDKARALASNEGDSRRFQGDSDGVRMERDELRSRLRSAQEENALLASEVTSLSQRMSQLQAKVESKQERVEEAGEVDMTRTAIRDLSQLVREKEEEIEALKSKNSSLLEVLKSAGRNSNVEEDVERLLEEKETLAGKVRVFQQDREALVAALNQKHSESVGYHAEIQRLMAFIHTERPKWQAAMEEAQGLRREVQMTEKSLCDLQETHNQLKVSHAALLREKEEAEQQKDEVEGGEEERRFRQQLERLTYELSESQIRLSDLNDHNTNVTRELQDARLEIDGLRQQNQILATAAASVGASRASERQQDEDTKEEQKDSGKGEDVTDDGVLTQLQRERDQLVMALQSKQSEDERLRREYQLMCDKETRLQGELQRLRQHLLQVEDTYTQDVLVAEEREKTLRDRLTAAEERLQACDSAVETANRAVVSRAADAERDVTRLKVERDTALAELSAAQRELHQQMASVNNLQLVLEQFQREKDNLVAMETEHYLKQIHQTKEDIAALRNALLEAENQLKEQTDAIEAARRITDEMSKKETRIAELEQEMEMRSLNINQLQFELERLNTNSENKIDKILMKNLLMSYFNTPSSKRQDALRVIAGLLQCSDEELRRLGVEINTGWFSSWLRPRKPSGNQPALDSSFTELFVKFLERESKPMPKFSLPTDQMVAEVKQQRSHPSPPPSPPPVALPDPAPAHALLLPANPTPIPLLTSSPTARLESRNALLSILTPGNETTS